MLQNDGRSCHKRESSWLGPAAVRKGESPYFRLSSTSTIESGLGCTLRLKRFRVNMVGQCSAEQKDVIK